MKQLNIWKTSFYTMLAIAAGAFTACVDDDVDKQAPTLELSEEAVAFTGTATEDATVTVRSNRQWTVAYEDEETQKEWMYFKVSGNEVSEGIYNGDGTVKITVGESAQPHMGRLIFTLSNSYGELYRKYLTVTQGNYVPPTVGAVGKLVEYILGNSDLSGAVGSDKAMPLQYSESTIEAVILANDAAGNNNRKLYVGDNNGLERSAIVLYGADFAMANDPVTKYPAGRKVTLNLENAKYYAFNNVRQLTDVVVTVGDEEVELVVPSLSVEKFNTGDYQAQYVKLNNMTPAQSFVGKPWTATESQSVTLNDASGKTLTVYMNKAQFATGFADMYVADKTGTIYGVAETYRENAQLIPTKKTDIAALSTDQGGGTDPDPTPGDAIYYESFGTADVSDKPLIADYTGWAKTGSGAGEVSYTGEGNMSIRTSGKLSAGYDGASGKNKAFFGTNNPALIINKIKLDGAQDLQLTFGAQYSKTIDYDAGLYDNEFKPEKFHLALSADGTSWTTVEYTYAQADEFWVFATSKFKLKNKAAYLYVKYAVDEASVFAIDDVTLAEGEGGTEVDLGEGGEEPEPTPGEAITVNELYRLAETVTGKDKLVIDAENNRTLEAVVVTDVDGGNVSANNLMVMTEGATQAKNGILLFSSGQYTNPKDPAFPFKSGDKVRFTLVKGLAKVANFSNCYEVTCESSDAATWLTAEVIGKAQLTPVPLTSIDNLIDYQGMLVTVKNVTSPATAGNWAVGTTTFKVGSSDLTVYVTQDAAGFAGKQYAASKTGDLTGYVSLYKGAVQLCPRNMTDAAAFAEGGTDPEPADPAHIVLDFSVGASIFTPALPDKEAQSKTGSYLFDGNYAFNISASNIFYWFQNPYEDSPGYGTKSLFIGKAGSYIELPAIADKALTKVIISAAKGAGAYSIAITDAAGTPVQGGQAQEVTKQEGGEYTYTLSNTANATAYRIAVTTAGNAQLAKIELFYGEGGGSTPVQPTLSVNPTSLSFAAKDQAKTIACTVANADGYTVGASSSDPANFAASAAGTTVTVTPTENTGSARNATVTVYLTNDGGATKVAAKTVAVTQAAAGGSEPAGDTYDKITKVAELVNGMTGFIGCEPGGTYGLQLVTGFAAYGQGFTAAYTYDETKKTLSLTSGNYTAIEFTFEAVADGFNIKQGDKYLIGTGIIDNGKPKQGLVLADAPAQPWTFTEDASGVIATTSASGTVDGQAFNYPAIYMMCANSASSRFLRPYVQASYGKGFCFFKKN
ncbi:hypothetical protein A5CBH24_20650 [Alistipes communis]|jgi:hypothetical protein|uniref:DUF5689 domain-containing protein n=2 Tax=Alistipes communis TaxID=2585118 RepID=A0A4Y1WV81_9BACT|nr:DUF5689 domain-containing protein [Alistipes communis]BBL04752.1 hypothetical protein A5CBH24_20650 [Alistipes communis]